MGQPIEPELQDHWASAPSHDGTARRLTRRANLGWVGLVLLLTFAGLLSAGYTLGLLDDWGELRPSPTKIVTSSAGGGPTDVTSEAGSIDSSARQFEASERERADR